MRRLARGAQELRAHASELAAHLHASQEGAARWRSEASDLLVAVGAQ